MATVAEIAAGLGFEFAGDGTVVVTSAAQPNVAGASDLALAMDKKFLPQLKETGALAAMVPPDADWAGYGLKAAIFTPRARYALSGVTRFFEADLAIAPGVHPAAVVDASAEVEAGASIGPLAVVGPGARVAAGARVFEHASVGAGAEIGADAILFPGARIGPRVVVGARTRVHENAVVGADGFSFVTPEKSTVESADATGRIEEGVSNTVWARIASLGSVRLGADVVIGAGATIDRGTVVDTTIGAGTKIDNLVQIGHNVQVGENCLFCGLVGIAGSAEIGDRVVLGGQVGVADHVVIGDDSMAMATAGVSANVAPRTIVGGTPALPREQAADIYLVWRRLPRLAEDVKELKKRFSSDKGSG